MSDDLIKAMHFDFDPVKEPLHEGTDPYVFTYAFRSSEPDTLPTVERFDGWTGFSDAEKAVFREAFDEIEGFANVVFREDPGARDPVIDFGKVDLGTNGRAGPQWGFRGDELASYDSFAVYKSSIDLSTRPDLVRHEIGHALGLKHPFEGGAELPERYQNNGYTVMSYTPGPDGEGVGDRYEILDVMTLQFLWGENPSSATDSRRIDMAGMDDGALRLASPGDGVEAIAAGDTSERATIDLRPGAFSSIGGEEVAAIALGAAVDTAIGGRAPDRLDGSNSGDTLVGGGGADVIVARSGSDEIRGGSGGDRLLGGRGEDLIFGGGGADTIAGGSGSDTVFGGGGADAIAGGGGSDTLRGGRGRDELFGDRGRDTLEGGGGADVLNGGRGGDALGGGRHGDVLLGGGGSDVLRGGAGADVLRGGRGSDDMLGQAGDDTLFGGGGRDELTGGRGDDVLFGGAGDDSFRFAAGDGDDVIRDFGKGDDAVVIADLGSRRAILDAAEERGRDVVVELEGQTLILRGTSLDAFEDGLILG